MTLPNHLTLERFFYLLSFQSKKELPKLTAQEIEQVRQDYWSILEYLNSKKGFTKMFRGAVAGKCNSLNGVILDYQKKKLPKRPKIEEGKVFVKY